MEKFSIVIPTLWKSNLLLKMLPVYSGCNAVSEIILINNDSSVHPDIDISKLKVITPGRNIYVNPAWNVGAAMAEHTIILANDDIFIEDLTGLLSAISQTDFDMIGATINDMTPLRSGVHPCSTNKFPRKSFGCFMVCRKFQFIPRELLIYSGDRFLFDQSSTIGLIGSGYIKTPVSQTMNSDPKFLEIGKQDVERYLKIRTV